MIAIKEWFKPETSHDREDDAFVKISLTLTEIQYLEYQKMLNGESKIPRGLEEEIGEVMKTTHEEDMSRARKFLIGKWVKNNIKS